MVAPRCVLSAQLLTILALSLPLAGCPTEPPARAPENFGEATEGDEPTPDPNAKAKAPEPPPEDAPEISRSRGPKGGVVVFWPRIWPRDDADPKTRDTATKIQKRLEALAKRAAGARSVELRPEPERVCPRDGCEATAVGAVLVLRNDACAVVAVVSGPGKSPSLLVPWSGKVKLAQERVAFREPPEEVVKVEDYVKCDKLLEGTEAKDAEIARTIAGLLPGG